MKFIQNTFLMACLLAFQLKAFAGPAFAVAPDRMHIQLNQTKTYAFIIKNTGDQLIHVRITQNFLTAESKALDAGKRLNTLAEEKQTSLVPYTIISPRVLSLEPTQQRDVRISIRPPKNLKPGTYREHISVKMLEVARQYSTSKKSNGKNVGINLNLLLQIAPVIYGDTGTNQAKVSLSCGLAKDGTLTLNAINKTPWHFSGIVDGYALSNAKKPLFTLHENIFRETQKTIHTAWKPDFNNIKLIWRNQFNTQAAPQTTICHLN